MSTPQKRQNCNNTHVPNTWLGGCFQHFNKRLDGVKVKKNATEMVNYHSPADPPYIPVEPLIVQYPQCKDPRICGDGFNNEQWCGPLTQSLQAPCNGGTSSWDMGRGYYNCYYQSNETESLTQCHTIGFRNVIAKKAWSGRFSYVSPEAASHGGIPDYFGWCGACWHVPLHATPDTTKYLACSAHSSFTITTQWYATIADGTCNCPSQQGPPCSCLDACGTHCDDNRPNCCVGVAHCGTTVNAGNASTAVHVDHYGNLFVDSCVSGGSCPTVGFAGYGCPDQNPGGPCFGCESHPINNTPEDYQACVNGHAVAAFNTACSCGNSDLMSALFDGIGAGGSGFFSEGWGSLIGSVGYNGGPIVTQLGPTEWHVASCPETVQCTDGCDNPTTQFTWTKYEGTINVGPGGGSIQIIQRRLEDYHASTGFCDSDGYCPSVLTIEDTVVSVGPTSIAASGISFYDCVSLEENGTWSAGGSLGTPYTQADVQAECIDLLSEWDLGDDKLWNGWRIDQQSTVAPLVSFDEGQSSPTLGNCEDFAPFTGDRLGLPGPENIDHMWDALHPNVCVCTDIYLTGDTCQGANSYGAWSDQCHVPRATQWTSNLEASNLPPDCGFISYKKMWSVPCDGWNNGCANIFNQCDCNPICGEPGVTAPPCTDCGPPNFDQPGRGLCGCGNKPGGGGILYMGKYATIIQNQQSYDFYNRPCGIDRFQCSASVGFCITGSDLSHSIVGLEPLGPPHSFSNNDFCFVDGTTDLDGLWKITSLGGYTIQLQEPRFVSASNLPEKSVKRPGTGMIYKLRWQSGSFGGIGLKPAICGRIAITHVTRPELPGTSSVFTCSLAEGSYLVNKDIITIENLTSSLGVNLNHDWTASYINNNTIALSGSNSITTTGSVWSGGEMFTKPNGGWVSDNEPKGDYGTIEYHFDYRDIGEYARLAYQSASLLSGYDPVSQMVTGALNCQPCDCNFNCSDAPGCPNPAIGPQPRPYQQFCGVYYTSFMPLHPTNACNMQCPGGPDFRGVEITMISCSDHCLPFNACKAGVAYTAPPGQDNFAVASSSVANYKYHGWNTPVLDESYGNLWIMGIKSTMSDPLFSAPPCYCDFAPEIPAYGCLVNWIEDDGTCEPYTEACPQFPPPCDYYAHRDVYEYRCTLPPGAPALPDGVRVGCSTIAQLNDGNTGSNGCGTGNVCMPPFFYGVSILDFGDGTDNCVQAPAIYPWNQPWALYLNELGCCCLNGRFCGGTPDPVYDNSYGDNGIVCFNNGIVNPP